MKKQDETKLKCPNCRRKIEVSCYSRYQDLVEHVLGPNDLPALKPEYRCPAFFPRCYPLRVFWDAQGDVYIPPSLIQRMLWKLNLYGLTRSINVPNAIK